MKTKFVPSLLVALGLTLSGAAMALDEAAVYEESVFTKAGDNTNVKIPGVDKDGDGCLAKAELTPGGQLEKRFGTRDANGDGKLCKDEYYTP